MDEEKTAQKARIVGIGLAWPHDPDEHGRIWSATDWIMDGGDFPGMDLTAGIVGGWTMAELALISDLYRLAGNEEALRLAEAYRLVPRSGRLHMAETDSAASS